MDIPFEILDREIARASLLGRAARASLDRGEPIEDDPLDDLRRASSRETFLDLAPRPIPPREPGQPLDLAAFLPRPSDEHRVALREWVFALTLDRVLWADSARLAAARRAVVINVDRTDLGRLEISPRDLLHRVIAEPEPRRRRLLAEVLEQGAFAVQDAARILEERRLEAARRLPADLDRLEIPLDPTVIEGEGEGEGAPVLTRRAALDAIAEDTLRQTEQLAPRAGRSWDEAVDAGVGRAQAEGWPARLGSRWIEGLFHSTSLTEGLRLDLGPLPRALGASSFLRALAAFGAALADADGPRGVPFTLACAPFDLRRARRSALFASLVADPVFGRRMLGLGRDAARDQARGVARSIGLAVRLAAARARFRGLLALPESARAHRFEEITAATLGAPIPPALAGVVPRLAPADATTFLGVLLAALDRRALVERFDEDWFRNPAAARAIREEDAAPPAFRRAPAALLTTGVSELVRSLTDVA
jgi:hypothetical protein